MLLKVVFAAKENNSATGMSPPPSPFPPGISSAITLRMEAGAKGKTYKIGQAATLLDVKPFVLRFWETEFKDVLVPVRTPSGQRAYSEANVELVREIKRLLYDEGLTIEGARKRLLQGKGKPGGQPGYQSSSQPGYQSGGQLSSQPGSQPSGQTPPQAPPAAAPAHPAHSIEPQHFPAQPPLPGLARPETSEAAQHARALAGTLADVYQELKVIRDLLS